MPSGSAKGQTLQWTVNCLVCHTAEIDGVAYLGAGTKTFDELWLGDALKRLTSDEWRRLPRGSEDAAVAADAHRILNSHHHDKIDSLTRARSTAFAASHVELYMRPHNGEMPRVEDVGRGDVKTPPLWHTAAKMPVGRWYADGSFHGRIPLMASSMELEKDRPFEALIQVVLPRIKHEFESVVRHFKPPRYPYEVDETLAARGRELFYAQDVGCSVCHGEYDGNGNVRWPGAHVDVGRIDGVSTSCPTGSWRRSMPAHWPLRASSPGAADTRPRRSPVSGRTFRIFTTAASRRFITCSARFPSGRGSSR